MSGRYAIAALLLGICDGITTDPRLERKKSSEVNSAKGAKTMNLLAEALETLFSESEERSFQRQKLSTKKRESEVATTQPETVYQMNAISKEMPHPPRGASAELFAMIETYAINAADDALKMAETRNLLIANAEDELLLGDREAFKQKIQDAIYKHLLNANIR